MDAYFNRFTITMTKKQAESASHPGACDSDVAILLNTPSIRRQLDKIPAPDIAEELREYGAWDKAELTDEQANRARIIWIAAGNIREESK
jgi:hypothetical protein